MREGNSYFLLFIAFLIGSTISYFFSQYVYLKLDNSVNIIESLIAIITIIVGLYIAITINKGFNNKQNLLVYLQPKLDSNWEKANVLFSLIQSNNSLDVSSLTANLKEVNSGLVSLNTIFKAFKIPLDGLTKIDTHLDNLEDDIFNNSTINANIVDYSAIIQSINTRISQLNVDYAKTIKYLHGI